MKNISAFINAPSGTSEELNTIAKLASKIRQLEIEAVTPTLEYSNNEFSINELRRILVAHLMKCEIVVTYGDWFNDTTCVIINDVARLLNIEVIHHSRINSRFSNLKD